jgi:hypothetical protein
MPQAAEKAPKQVLGKAAHRFRQKPAIKQKPNQMKRWQSQASPLSSASLPVETPTKFRIW